MICDGDWVLTEWRPDLGRTIWTYFDGIETHTRVVYDIEAQLKHNKMLRDNTPQHLSMAEGVGVSIGEIPAGVFYSQLLEPHQEGDNQYIQNWLNRSENAMYRTR